MMIERLLQYADFKALFKKVALDLPPSFLNHILNSDILEVEDYRAE